MMLAHKLLDSAHLFSEHSHREIFSGQGRTTRNFATGSFPRFDRKISGGRREVVNLVRSRGEFGLQIDTHKEDDVQLGGAIYVTTSRRLFDADEQEILLRAQSAEVLHYMVQQVGTLVSRDDLITHIWSDVAVTDDSLTQCIRDIRKAIGDTTRSVLVTVPKRGYLLKGSPTAAPKSIMVTMTAANAKVSSDVDAPPQATEGIKPLTTVDAAAPLLMADLDPRDVLPTLAVLPFKSDQPDTVDIYGVFLADEIAKLLSMTKDVNVISRLSTGTMGGLAPELQTARQTMNVDFVLSGYLVRLGTRVAVSIEFSEVDTGFVLWSERMQFPFDPTQPETEGLEVVVANIRRAITLNEVRRISSKPIPSLKLFSILHGAVGLMHRFSPTDFHKAKDFLEHLRQQAPRHPAPLAWLARWHVLNSAQGWAHDPEKDAEAALDLTARALDLDPFHTLALVCEGQVLMHLVKDLDTAEQRYDLALESNPNDANGRSLRGMLLAFSDRGDLGKRDTERAMHLTPLDPHRFMYLALNAGACLATEDYDRALVLTRESLRLNREHASSLRMLPVALLGAGQEEAAYNAAKTLRERYPDFRVGAWLRSTPSAQFKNGRRFADMLRTVGVPE